MEIYIELSDKKDTTESDSDSEICENEDDSEDELEMLIDEKLNSQKDLDQLLLYSNILSNLYISAREDNQFNIIEIRYFFDKFMLLLYNNNLSKKERKKLKKLTKSFVNTFIYVLNL